MNKLISVVLPTKNEEDGIVQTIQSIPKGILLELGYETQVIVIDSSLDKTARLAEQEGALVIHEPRKGVGTATKTGLQHSSGDIIVIADGDNTYPLDKLPSLLRMFNKYEVEFLSTNRFAFPVNGAMSFKNKIGNKVLTRTFQMIYGLPHEDSQSGMMMFTRELLGRMQLKSNIPLSQELKIEACFYERCASMEVPIIYRERVGKTKVTGGLTGWKVGFGNLVHLFKKRIRR